VADHAVGAVAKKVSRHLIWFLVLLYVLRTLDGNASGFAALSMNADRGLTSEMFGIGTGLFFLGIMLAEVPSNIVLAKVGARRWLARIAISWGIVAAGISLTQGPRSFYALRFLLGVAEAGAFPGIVLYLTYWLPRAYTARYLGLFLTSVPLSNAIAGPLASTIELSLNGVFGLRGWQWIYLVEGGFAVIAGIAALFYLVDNPSQANWLSPEEKSTLLTALAADRNDNPGQPRGRFIRAMFSPKALALGVAYGGITISVTTASSWLPQILARVVHDRGAIGFLTPIPFLCGGIAMVLWGRSSDARGERIVHVSLAAAVAALGWFLSLWATSSVATVIAISIALAGSYASLCVFWSLPPLAFPQAQAPQGIAWISVVGLFFSTLSPWIIGRLRDQSGDFDGAFWLSGVASILVIFLIVGAKQSLPCRKLTLRSDS
jgi:MFS transporter, ACS family, tartrate transporter